MSRQHLARIQGVIDERHCQEIVESESFRAIPSTNPSSTLNPCAMSCKFCNLSKSAISLILKWGDDRKAHLSGSSWRLAEIIFIKELVFDTYMEAVHNRYPIITQKGAEQDETRSVYQELSLTDSPCQDLGGITTDDTT